MNDARMKAIAIDDEPLALEVIKSHASKVPFLELKATFTDAFKALEYLQTASVDLIFLDIKMPDISGIEFYNSLNNKPMVIFTTAYSEHAVMSFELDAVDYLLKPFPLARFIKGCNKAYELSSLRRDSGASESFFIKDGYEQTRVLYDDIQFLEAAGNYVTYHLRNRKVLSRSTFMEAISQLPPGKFVRVHRSFYVAIDKIEKIERQQLIVNNTKIPVSEAYRKDILSLLKT